MPTACVNFCVSGARPWSFPTTRPESCIHPFDRDAYRRRNLVERMFCRLKDWRRIATRYDKLARNFLSAATLAATIIWWA